MLQGRQKNVTMTTRRIQHRCGESEVGFLHQEEGVAPLLSLSPKASPKPPPPPSPPPSPPPAPPPYVKMTSGRYPLNTIKQGECSRFQYTNGGSAMDMQFGQRTRRVLRGYVQSNVTTGRGFVEEIQQYIRDKLSPTRSILRNSLRKAISYSAAALAGQLVRSRNRFRVIVTYVVEKSIQ